jgi:hypothetical protein
MELATAIPKLTMIAFEEAGKQSAEKTTWVPIVISIRYLGVHQHVRAYCYLLLWHDIHVNRRPALA